MKLASDCLTLSLLLQKSDLFLYCTFTHGSQVASKRPRTMRKRGDASIIGSTWRERHAVATPMCELAITQVGQMGLQSVLMCYESDECQNSLLTPILDRPPVEYENLRILLFCSPLLLLPLPGLLAPNLQSRLPSLMPRPDSLAATQHPCPLCTNHQAH